MAGTLYLVATPIGNLEDITYRAVRILGSVAAIACEDTRQTRKLLDRFGIRTPAVSYHEHNEAARTSELAARLESGEDIAVVSDAGTPLVSDPGYRLVREAAARGIAIVPVPGPCAAIAALSASGLPTEAFSFHGFPPRKPGERKRFFESLSECNEVVVLYEAPHRILETLAEIESILRDPPVAVARELTKIHEEFLRGRASEVRASLAARGAIKGEFTIVVGKSAQPAPPTESVAEAVARLEASGLSRMEAIKTAAREFGLPKRVVYSQMEMD